MNWKIIAIIFMILFLIETSLVIWSFWYASRENERAYECLYDICSDNYDAWYEDEVCTCYDLDMFGEYVVSKTKYMGSLR